MHPIHSRADSIAQSIEQFIAIRRDLHAHPELAFEEVRTSGIVAKLLASWGIQVHTGIGKTGVVGVLKRGTSSKSIGLRADMDALPIVEMNDIAHKSTIDGKFHGCGHDGHTAILLAAAYELAHHGDFDGVVHFYFQPAEEILGGGPAMIDDGLFERFGCDRLFALHNLPRLDTGKISVKSGVIMASCDTLHLHIYGLGSHGAMPEYGIDATLVACQIAVALQSIVARNISPLASGVITVGHISSGDASNVVNDYALMKLSVRALDDDTRATLVARIEKLATDMASSFGAQAHLEQVEGCPCLINDDEMADYAKQVAVQLFGSEQVMTTPAPLMASEDFSYMLRANPKGAYVFVGNGGGASARMLHNARYEFNDACLVPAATLLCGLVDGYLGVGATVASAA